MALAAAFDIRDGELLYSALARHADAMRYPSARAVNRAAFGRHGIAVIDLPGHLDALACRAHAGRSTGFNAEELIRQHTLLPYYALFAPSDRIADACRRMRTGSCRTLHGSLGIRASCVRDVAHLRFCPLCLRDDRQRFGTGHWHTAHQLAGVLVCHKHGGLLRPSVVSRSSSRSRLQYTSLESNLTVGMRTEATGGDRASYGALLAAMAEDSALLLATMGQPERWRALLDNADAVDAPIAWYRLRMLMSESGYVHPSGRIRLAALRRSLRATLTSRTCAMLGIPSLDSDASEDWVARLGRPSRQAMHPLLYLAVLRALERSVTDLLGTSPTTEPPCPTTLPAVVVTRTESSDAARTEAKAEEWQEALQRYVADPGMSLRAIARALDVDPKTVQRRARAIGVWRESWATWDAVAPAPDVGLRRSRAVIAHRHRWTALRVKHPLLARTALRAHGPATYSYLYRYDRDWLELHSPQRLARSVRRAARVDWAARDRHLLKQAQSAVAALQADGHRSPRIRPATIARRMGHTTLLAQHGAQLPRTLDYIQRHAESREDFGKRRLEIATRRLLAANTRVARWQLLRLAGLRPDLAMTLQPHIDGAMHVISAWSAAASRHSTCAQAER